MKQTAVDYLTEQLPIRILNQFQKEISKAKAMEQQQIINAYVAQMDCTDIQLMKDTIGKQYYNETYQK